MARFMDEMEKCRKNMERYMPLAEKELAELTAEYKKVLASSDQLDGDVRYTMKRLSEAISNIEGKLHTLEVVIEYFPPLMKDFDKIYSEGIEATEYLEEMGKNFRDAATACDAKGLTKAELSERQKKLDIATKAYDKALRSHSETVNKFDLLARTWRTNGVVIEQYDKDDWASQLKVLTGAMSSVGAAMVRAEQAANRFD